MKARFMFLQQAEDPTTSPERLQELATSPDPAIRQAVAANPNTPLETLWQLAREFPHQFWENPILPLLVLEQPDFIDEIPSRYLTKLITETEPPEWFWQVAMNRRGTLRTPIISRIVELLEMKESPKWFWRLVVSCNDAKVRNIAADCIRKLITEVKPPEWFWKLMAEYRNAEVREIADTHSCDLSSLLEELVADGDSYAKFQLTETTQTSSKPPEWSWKIAVGFRSEEVRGVIANHELTPFFFLEKLAADEAPHVRSLVAGNPNTLEGTLQYLAKDADMYVKIKVAGNPSTPLNTLQCLAENDYQVVRKVAVKHIENLFEMIELPTWFWKSVASCSYAEMRNIVADRIGKLITEVKPPKWFWKLLAGCRNAEVRQIADTYSRGSSSLLGELAADEVVYEKYYLNTNFQMSSGPPEWPWKITVSLRSEEVRGVIANHELTPSFFLEKLAADEAPHVRSLVAGNPNTPEGTLQCLAKDTDMDVKIQVAGNPSTPLYILKCLAENIDADVREAGVKHIREVSMKQELAEASWQLLTICRNKRVRVIVANRRGTPPSCLEKLSTDEYSRVRVGVAGNPNTPTQTLQRLAKDPDVEVRRELAGNPNAPVDILQHLAKDPDTNVRLKVADNLNTPVDTLQHLLRDMNCGVRNQAGKALLRQKN